MSRMLNGSQIGWNREGSDRDHREKKMCKTLYIQKINCSGHFSVFLTLRFTLSLFMFKSTVFRWFYCADMTTKFDQQGINVVSFYLTASNRFV